MEDPRDPNDAFSPTSGHGANADMPRWVKVFQYGFIFLFLLVIALHLAGFGFHDHGADSGVRAVKQP